jgi:Domain of unknown function (DUF4111)
MVSDIDVFMGKFEEDTRNLLLRLARIWQTVVTGIIDRKDGAAEWVQENLPSDYQHLMERARAMYLGWQADDWTDLASEARAAADYMISQNSTGDPTPVDRARCYGCRRVMLPTCPAAGARFRER